ncbi:MAG: IS66 family insertion sequence element accessory protein TnpB [Myxococcales bacterium]|nr:IS66 family insertion sequence element accessory protein TnpB [Myxococcales bacterium]
MFLAVQPVDMRGSFDALAGSARGLGLDPVDGHLYVFTNKRRRIVRALWFDGSGWCILSKRLERGSFQWPELVEGWRASRSARLCSRRCWLASTSRRRGSDGTGGRAGRGRRSRRSTSPKERDLQCSMDTSSASRIATLEAENARLLHTMEATTAEFAAG